MNQIIAAIDFSEVTSAVVENAMSIAAAFSTGLTILHVAAPDPAFVGFAAGPQTVRDARAHELREEHRQLLMMAESCGEQGIEAKAHLVEGPTVETIFHEAHVADAGMIVIGSHGHGAVYNVLVGSVSAGVLKAAQCPVLVIPTGKRDVSESDE